MLLLVYDRISYSRAVTHGYQPDNQAAQTIIIKRGDTAQRIANELADRDIIKHARFLTRYLDQHNLENKIMSGRFRLNPSLSLEQITTIITDAARSNNAITIPEGYTVKQIDGLLDEQGIAASGIFSNAVQRFNRFADFPWLPRSEMQTTNMPLEGFLFPDTYAIDAGNFNPDDLINLMLKTFEKKALSVIHDAQKTNDLFDTITIASMLEKEVRHENDAPIVAGIIGKRMAHRWFLNIDAALLYEKSTRTLTKDDLKNDSPYNTYTRKGLPLGPIGNPGLAMIRAALHPTDSKYWFYLTDPKTGNAVFAVNNGQQNMNRVKYLR